MIADFLPVLMFLALLVLMFSGYPVAFVLGGVGLAFGVIGMAFGVFSPGEFNNIVFRIWGVADNILLVSVPMFVLMGITLERSGVAEDLLDSMARLFSRVRGGLAIAVTLMGTVLAASTGIIGASVVMMGVIALPSMLRRGYQPELALGTICASGTLGILIPPSIMLVLIGDLLQIPVGDLFMGAVFPGLLLSGLYMIYIAIACIVRPSLAPLQVEDRIPGETAFGLLLGTLRSLLPPTFLIILVLGSIFFGLATPTEAAGVGALGALILGIANRRLSFHALRDVVDRSAKTTAMVFAVFIGATAYSYVFRSLGGEDLIVDAFRALPFGAWGVLAIIMALVFVLGFFFDWVEIILIVLPMIAPVLKHLDFGAHIPPTSVALWFAMLIAVNLQTSFLTPPFGFALFYLKGVAPPEVTLQHIYRGIVPFVCLQVLGLVLVALFPVLVTWMPQVAFR